MTFEYEVLDNQGYMEFIVKPNEHITGFVPNISGWLESDVQGSGENYLPRIREIIFGSDYDEELFWGNAYKALVRKDTTTISYDFEDGNPEMVPCTLPTQMLYEILEVWIKVRKEYREKTKKKEE